MGIRLWLWQPPGMCGIFGIIGHGVAFTAEQRVLATQALAHRGPDDEGYLELKGSRVTAHLLQRRLSILDLSALGHQPMVTDDGRYSIVFNGEVYNHQALREELELVGVSFRSTCDTEVVLQALVTWGDDAVERFVGMFAFALWDSANERLFMARDRLGKKPLYWGRNASTLYFSSETQALLKANIMPARLDAAGLRAWFATAAALDPQTPLEGIEALLPAHTLSWAPGTDPVIRLYWNALQRPARSAPADWWSKLQATLQEAVKMRLEADVPAAVFLSGGVDSAAITALAAKGEPERVTAFTVSFDEARFDERERASAIARHLGVKHHIVSIRPESIIADLDAAFDAQDLPSHDGVNTWLVSRAAREAGFVVALAGTGGDELFAGYQHFLNLQRWRPVTRITRLLPARARDALDAAGLHRLPTRLRKALTLASCGDDLVKQVKLVRQVFASSQIRALLPNSHAPKTQLDAQDFPAIVSGGYFSAITRVELTHYMRNTQLRDIDAMSMAHSLEIRAPLLDHRVVEQVLALPDSVKGPHQGVNKALLVDLAGLPHSLMRAPKMGFVLPWEVWLRGPLRTWAETQLFQSPSGGQLDRQEVKRLWSDFLQRRPTVNYTRILALIALYRWSRRHSLSL